jgi:hypothetical protein
MSFRFFVGATLVLARRRAGTRLAPTTDISLEMGINEI